MDIEKLEDIQQTLEEVKKDRPDRIKIRVSLALIKDMKKEKKDES